MAFSRLYTCDTCEQGEVLLTFAAEWGADSTESAPSLYTGYGTVRGLFSNLWCSICVAVRPLVLLRLDPPATHPVVAFAEAQKQGLMGMETGQCRECAGMLQNNAEGVPCPCCAHGHLRLVGEWEDA